MGGATSTARVESNITNSALTDIMMENSSKCSMNSSNIQKLKFSDINAKGCSLSFNNISQDATIDNNLSCAQDASQASNLANQFKTELDQQVKAALSGLPGAVVSASDATTINNLTNEIKTNINLQSLAECMASTSNEQLQEYGKIEVDCTGMPAGERKVDFSNISQKLMATNVAKCIQSQKTVSEAANKLDSIIEQKAESINSGIDIAASFASLGIWLIPLIIVMVVCLMFVSVAMSMQQQE
jgi:hypothetical protein